jgi:hypothetical protein
VPGIHDMTEIDGRLDALTNVASNLGFTLLLDAGLVDIRLWINDPSAKDRLKTFVVEMDSDIFNYHSSKVSPWKDISRVIDKVLRDQLCTHNVDRLPAGMKYTTKDMFAEGLVALANTENIEALKKAMRVSDGSNWDEPEGEDEDESTRKEASGTEDDHERE